MISDPEYGDITDLNDGLDIDVTFIKEPQGKQYPETKILPKRRSGPVVDPKHPKVKELMTLITEKQPNILDVYQPATYDELSQALEEFLTKSNKGSEENVVEEQTVEEQPVEEESTVEEPTEEELDNAGAPKSDVKEEVKSPSAEKAEQNKPKSSGTVDDYTAAFSNIFGDENK